MPAVAKTGSAAILETAYRQVRASGLRALSLRGLAREVGIAPNALYHYFPDRAHLEAAISELAAAQLLSAIERALKLIPAIESEQRLRALVERYLRYARREPHLYDVLLDGKQQGLVAHPAHEELWALVVREVAGMHGEPRAAEAAVSLWALLHGAVLLGRAGVCEIDADGSIAFGLSAWMHGGC